MFKNALNFRIDMLFLRVKRAYTLAAVSCYISVRLGKKLRQKTRSVQSRQAFQLGKNCVLFCGFSLNLMWFHVVWHVFLKGWHDTVIKNSLS